jgi:uncharacterized protein GlcG (DUF336 family)
MPLPVAEARAYADKAIARAAEMRIKIGVAVVDELGQLVQLDRMDGSRLMAADVCEQKALTALNFHRSTSAVGEGFKNAPERMHALQAIVHFQITPMGGGLPIVRDGEVIGAIGISGGTAEEDEQIATAALS